MSGTLPTSAVKSKPFFTQEWKKGLALFEKCPTEQQTIDLRLVLKTLREMTDVETLTPTVVNTLIQRIEIHANEKKHSHNNVKVGIYFTAMGMVDIPTEQEIAKLMDEIQKDPQKYRIVA